MKQSVVLCVPKTQTGRNGRIDTDKLRSYGAALREIDYSGSHELRTARQQPRGELASAGPGCVKQRDSAPKHGPRADSETRSQGGMHSNLVCACAPMETYIKAAE
jgi:hypothetical protein